MTLAAGTSEMLWYSAREAARQLSAHVTPPISGVFGVLPAALGDVHSLAETGRQRPNVVPRVDPVLWAAGIVGVKGALGSSPLTADLDILLLTSLPL